MSDINNINNYNFKAQLNNISKDSQIKKSCVKEEETLFKKQMQEDTEFSELNELTQLPVEKAKPLNEKLMALLNAKKEQATVEETTVEPENTETVASAEPTAAEETAEAAEVTSDAELPATGSETPNTEESEDIPNDDDGIVRIPQNYTNSEKSTNTVFDKSMPKAIDAADMEALINVQKEKESRMASFTQPSVPLDPTTPGSVEFTAKILGSEGRAISYDAQGRIVLTRTPAGLTSIRYNDDGTITTTTETKDFDEPQFLSHVTEKTFDQDGNLINKTSTTKNKRAKLPAEKELAQSPEEMIEILKKYMAKADNNNSIISDAGGDEERKILPEKET